MFVLEEPCGYKFNRRTYEYESITAKGTIVMEHEGRYITLRKNEDKKKEFRYDLVTGEFERINHYKTKEDKITRTKASNITNWFTDCRLVSTDEKFTKLYLYAKSHNRNNFRSIVRFIELFAKRNVQLMEQWLSLGINFDEIEDAFNRLIGKPTYYSNFYSTSTLHYAPHEYNKELLEYIKEENRIKGHLSFNEVNELHDYWNDGQHIILNKIEKIIEEKPQYQPIFIVPRYNYRINNNEYVNVLTGDDHKGLRNNIIKAIKNFNLDLNALLEYMLYLNHVESVGIQKLMADYPDYLRRELYLKGGKMSKMNKYPETWLTTTHKQLKEYENLQRLERLENTGGTKEFDNSIEANKHLEWKKGNYLIRMPKDAEDIRDEADQMDHCVATYIPDIEAGKRIVMFMRDKEKPDKSLVTVEVIDNAITQAYAKKDSQPSSACMIWLTKWAAKKGLRITASTL